MYRLKYENVNNIMSFLRGLFCFRNGMLFHSTATIIIFTLLTIPCRVESTSQKKVTFGGVSEIPPYEFIDNNGRPSGYVIDIIYAISEELGWKAEIRLGNSLTIKNFLDSGTIDVITMAASSEERLKVYSYSIPYHESRYSVFINTIDLDRFNTNSTDNLQPVAYRGGIIYQYMKKKYPSRDIFLTDRPVDTLSHISLKKESFTVINKFIGLYIIKQYGIENVISAGEPVLVEKYHFAALKKNADLISGLNEGLNIIKLNGKFNSIYNRWFNVLEKDEKEDINFLTTIPIIVVAILLIYLFFLSWSLRKKVHHQTTLLSDELTRHTESEKALLDREERSRLIIENAPIGIIHFNNLGELTTFNENFVKISGIPQEELNGYNVTRLLDSKAPDLIESVLNGKPGYYEEIYYSDKTNKTTPLRIMLTPVILSDGTVNGGIGIIEDNSARKKYEEELLHAKNAAESASDIKTDFLANMSHEVRTPLNGILGMLQLIQTTGVTDEQANYINIAIKSGMRLTRLLNDILDLSRIETDKLVLTETKFSLKSVTDFIIERYESECNEKGVKLLLSVTESTPDEIIGDEIRIRQVLVNLISNSVKFTKSGYISVKINAEDISCYGEINIIISVKDTGIGITESMMNRIFEPFRQGENSYRRKFQGAGLGLTLVRHLIDLMNGTINIDSTPGMGTSIECILKVKLPENQPLNLKLPSEGNISSGIVKTILIAEDERINRLALKRILEKAGYRIIEAENGIEALDLLEKENPDCILMDIQMPEMDGIEATIHIRSSERFKNKSTIPIIALTAYTMPEDRIKINSAGIDDYISKPVNMEYLIKTLSRFTGHG